MPDASASRKKGESNRKPVRATNERVWKAFIFICHLLRIKRSALLFEFNAERDLIL